MEIRIVNEAEFLSLKKEFSELYELCFNQTMSEDEVVWRYLKNPNKNIIACFAFDNGKLIANYSVSPIEIYINNFTYPAVLSLNTMTHPDYVGKGLFVELANRAYSYAKEKGYIGVIGFPNNISNRTFVSKLGWSDLLEIPTLSLDLSNIKKIPQPEELMLDTIQFDNNFSLDYDHLKYEYNQNLVIRNTEYLKWRFCYHPNNLYVNFAIADNNDIAVDSYVVCKRYKRIFNIVDYYYTDICTFKKLIWKIIDYARNNECEKVTLWSKLGSEEHLFLEKLNFKNDLPITYFGGKLFDERSTLRKDFYNGLSWNIKLSDDNVY